LRAKLLGLRGWPLIMDRNRWFQQKAVATISHLPSPNSSPTLFAYSYAALDLFRYAKKQGWRTVLGQIDPGPAEERIVMRLHSQPGCDLPSIPSSWQPAPAEYWALWKHECGLADEIIVNSEWSKKALLEEGVPPEKLRVIPLAFEEQRLGREEKAMVEVGAGNTRSDLLPNVLCAFCSWARLICAKEWGLLSKR